RKSGEERRDGGRGEQRAGYGGPRRESGGRARRAARRQAQPPAAGDRSGFLEPSLRLETAGAKQRDGSLDARCGRERDEDEPRPAHRLSCATRTGGVVTPTKEVRSVAVIGAGTMGRGIAQVAAVAGFDVTLHDALEGAAEAGIEKIG